MYRRLAHGVGAALISGALMVGIASPVSAQLVVYDAATTARNTITAAVFLNLTAIYYSVARWLFLRDTGRKLLHLDRQLATDDAVLDDLRSYLK